VEPDGKKVARADRKTRQLLAWGQGLHVTRSMKREGELKATLGRAEKETKSVYRGRGEMPKESRSSYESRRREGELPKNGRITGN